MVGLGSPMTLAHGPAWPNRMVLAPLTNRQSNADGTVSNEELRWLERRAEGGFGLVMTCASHISPNGQGFVGQLGMWSDRHIAGMADVAAAIRASGSRSSVQLYHGGLRADAQLVPNRVAPWDDLVAGVRSLTSTEVGELVEEFVTAAVRAEKAGFDGVEVHGGHGYLVGQFLDSAHNHRTDGYGTTFDGRARFLREVLSGIRGATGEGFQVGLRLSPERHGIRLADARRLAQEMMLSGLIDYLDMSLWNVFKTPREETSRPSRLIEHFTAFERGTARLGVAGKILSATDAEACLEAGVDFVVIGTGGILHHDFAARVIADPAFVAVTPPVSADYLAAESVGPRFVEYLAEIRQDFVVID